MNDFARLCIGLRDRGGGLGGGQIFQNSPSDPGVNPQAFECSDDPVASKHCAEPRNARVGVAYLGISHDHHLDIGQRARDPVVELSIGRINLAGALAGGMHILGSRGQSRVVLG